MYEAPTMFWTLWHLVSPFIDPETKQKVVFVSSKSAISEFQKAIDPLVSLFVCFDHSAHTLCLFVVWHSCLIYVYSFTWMPFHLMCQGKVSVCRIQWCLRLAEVAD